MKIERTSEPPYLSSDTVQLAIEKLEEFYSSTDRSQKRYDFPFNKEIDKALKKDLHTMFGGKCGYCEVKIELPEQGMVDRFRPHSGIREMNEYFEDLYWWLTFRWGNLIYCCKECQQFKANYFPIKGKRAMSKYDDLGQEDCLLIDPCNEDPGLHFNYDDWGKILSLSDYGTQTIKLLRLNRDSHRSKRMEARIELDIIFRDLKIKTVNNEIYNKYVEYLKRIYYEDPTVEFLSYKRWYLSERIEDDLSIPRDILGIEPPGEAVEIKVTPKTVNRTSVVIGDNIVTNDYFPIEYIRIQNFKAISDLTIHFKEDEVQKKSWLFLLGENGVGKSSILQAIAVGMNADENFLTPLLPQLIKKGEIEAHITIKERNSENILTTVITKESITHTGRFNSFLVGYGSLRLSVDEVDEEAKLDDTKISYQNLFKPIKPLNDITAWLKTMHKNNSKFFDAIAYSIKQLLPHDFSDNELTVKDEIMFKNSEKSFSELSDGFKSTIILAVDIMMKLSSAKADMDKMSGIVLIDELGNQLHPRWQMRIVKQLRTVFPNLNFIISTHHPLCLRGAEQGEILLLKNIDNKVEPITELPDPSSLRVDQILASEFFGLSSLIDPELEAKFNRYYALLAKEKSISKEEQSELTHLKDELRNQKQLGASLREELMYHVIDRLLASKVTYDKQPLNREQLKEEVVKRVGEIWKQFNISMDDTN
jgi:uncharacterized protein (TIGR02646 family)